MRIQLIALLTVAVCQSPDPRVEVRGSDPWDDVRMLVGHWKGEVEGWFMQAEVERNWEFVLGGKFLQGHSRSVHGHQVDEELDMLSWDKVRRCFVLRRFSSSGYVLQFAGKVRQNGRLELETEAWENGRPYPLRAKIAFAFVSEDELEVTFYMALKNQELVVYSVMKLARVDR